MAERYVRERGGAQRASPIGALHGALDRARGRRYDTFVRDAEGKIDPSHIYRD